MNYLKYIKFKIIKNGTWFILYKSCSLLKKFIYYPILNNGTLIYIIYLFTIFLSIY